MKPSNQLIMGELREDHRNMALILDLLDKTSDIARRGQDPDLELIEEVMRYMTVYADAVHHPKEDLVYAELQTRRPDLADGLGDVPEDHWKIAALGTLLRADVDAIIAGAAVRRERLVRDMQRYSRKLRKHMQWEESDLFPRIDRMIDEDTQDIGVGDSLRIKDPVFEQEIESAFRRLMASLKDD